MLRPRLHKVLSDLWDNKIRSLLVIASIAVGLIALGMIASMYVIITEDMSAGYAAVNPANIVMSVSSFDEGLVDHIKNLPGVRQVEGVAWVLVSRQDWPRRMEHDRYYSNP